MLSRNAFLALILALLCSAHVPARAYDALEVCRGQSLLTKDIHNCLDNYLDLLDKNLNELTIFIDGELRGAERATFSHAQNSFYSFRRENCLWYLEIGGGRVQAEQVAKNCLSNMTQDRLAELQSLIAEYQNPEAEQVQQVSRDLALEPIVRPVPDAIEELTAAPVPEISDAENEGVSAFLGAWQVICSNESSTKSCTTDVPLEPVGGDSKGSILRITHRGNNRPSVELHFPNDELDSPDKLSWRIDTFSFGAVPGSLISVDDEVSKQIIGEVKFVRDELMPLFQSGSIVGVKVLDEVGGDSGAEFEATLVGFERAKSFAEDYINGELQ